MAATLEHLRDQRHNMVRTKVNESYCLCDIQRKDSKTFATFVESCRYSVKMAYWNLAVQMKTCALLQGINRVFFVI